MRISELLDIFCRQEAFRTLERNLGKERSFFMQGLNSSACSFFVSAVSSLKPSVNVFIANNKEDASYYATDLANILGEENVFYMPTSAVLSSTGIFMTDNSQKVQRTAAIKSISEMDGSKVLVYVLYPHSLMEGIPVKESVDNRIVTIEKGSRYSYKQLIDTLVDNHFEKVDFVTDPGQFSVRGSIIDVFSYSDNRPYRIDFFGDDVENIRVFDINSQRSVNNLLKIDICPNIYEEEENVVSLFDYIGREDINVFFDDYMYLIDQLHLISGNGYKNYLDDELVKSQMDRYTAFHISGNSDVFKDIVKLEFEITPQPVFNKNFELLYSDIKEKTSEGYTVYILSDNDSQLGRLRQIFDKGKFGVNYKTVYSSIHLGFIDHRTKIAVYTDHQIFNRYHKVRLKNSVEKSERLTINDLNAYNIGDYIVHIDHGVGIYGGLVKTNVNGIMQEAVKLIYKDKDVIFVSVHSLHRISKYRSKDGTPPKIYKLGTGAWQKLKNQTKKKVKDIAKDLIKLYADRKSADGYAFSPDSYLQHELEASFMYEDTPDQIKAVSAIKKDMESHAPMDRLVCGDVGFGKTEVAIRAAFKAVADSKQVAVLVPTTILALQHFNTFQSRLKDFPCNIEFISRLRTAKEIKEIIGRLKEGRIDILIGTHRLLNKEIQFKDLGLLIIDEEQKFGVAAKEKLRQMKISVDTLTLTATPIPRTLQFSLLGARDMSIINTPPSNRLPVHTEIINFNEDYIKNIIEFELKRNGQVYFVHNKVEDIMSVAGMIQNIVPEARICVGHGQMDANTLESRILDFIDGDYDILVATSIVENGIDVPNANTIIINQAQNFGLSDLHQLRGRVGRSNKQSYCYLLAPPMVSISDDSRRRLKAIETFSDLGSGFNIAMQDLDIRGAGNLLGGEQSGFIADMGYETYQRVLSEAIEEVREELDLPVNEENASSDYATDTIIDADMQLLIPETYIDNKAEKIRVYKELDGFTDELSIQRFRESIEDRFGKMPEEVSELFNIVRLRIKASELSFEKVVLKNGIMLAYFISDSQSRYYQSDKFSKMMNVVNENPAKLRFKERNGKIYLSIPDIKKVQDACDLMDELKSKLK